MNRHHLRHVAMLVLFLSAMHSLATAQTIPDTARIAYEHADRTAIYAKKLGSSSVDTLIRTVGTVGVNGYFHPSHIAALASSADGKSLLIACRLTFYNAQFSAMDSFECFARLDSPYSLKGCYITATDGTTANRPIRFGTKDNNHIFNVLRVYYSNTLTPQKPLPLGVLSPDGKEWYGTWRRTSVGDSVQFFHGNFDGSGITDTATLRGSDAPIAGFKMTNLITNASGKTMLAALSENVQQTDAIRMVIVRWTPGASGGNVTMQTSNITNLVTGFSSDVYWNIDSIFGFTLRSLPETPDKAELGLFARKTRNMNFFQFPISNGITQLIPDPNSFSIPGSAVPDKNLLILSGFTRNSVDIEDSNETISSSSGGPYGSGGDIMFSPTGDSVVFITCASDQSVTPAASAIYLYDGTSNKSYLVVNNTNEIERQPIFMGHVPVAAPPPPYVRGVGSLSSSTLDFGNVYSDSTTAQKGVTVTDIKSGKIIVHSATIGGADASAFSLVGAPSFPVTVNGLGTLNLNVSFKPTAEKNYNATLTIVYRDSLTETPGPDSILTATLSGVGTKRPDNGSVRPEAEHNFQMTLVPNPFKTTALVSVTARIAGVVRMEIVDLQGHSRYSSEPRSLGEGEQTSFSFDAKALELPSGSYFVVLHTPSGDVMHKAIVTE
ncbi:MAG: hypothetical protein JSS75_01675 [Bacteroidetes bacterium]|nr:hypothetical protein [Bacteroidota bacterium]